MNPQTPESAALPAAFLPETAHPFAGEWNGEGEDLLAFFSRNKKLALALIGGASTALSSCTSNPGTAVENSVKVLAESPLQFLVPAVLVGLVYGELQALWRATFRPEQEPFEQTRSFQENIVPLAVGNGLIDRDDPDQIKALAKTLAAVLGIETGGRQQPWHKELWNRSKVLAPTEAKQWGTAALFWYITLRLFESINMLPPDSPERYGTYAVIALASFISIYFSWEAIKPSKQ